jgi:hypothetical protein
MQNGKTISRKTIKALSLTACAVLCTALTAVSARADDRAAQTQPDVPKDVRVPAEARLFLVGHAYGTQNYVCLPSGTAFAFALFTPEATLFNDDAQQITTHFFSPNPDEDGIIRATWESSRDTSTVWGKVVGQATVRTDSIAWLRVDITGTESGPTGGDKLVPTKFIQRINTVGGVAKADECAGATDVGKKAFVPYTADYLFYKLPRPE